VRRGKATRTSGLIEIALKGVATACALKDAPTLVSLCALSRC
jgi:hypothetical protein